MHFRQLHCRASAQTKERTWKIDKGQVHAVRAPDRDTDCVVGEGDRWLGQTLHFAGESGAESSLLSQKQGNLSPSQAFCDSL